MKPLGLLQAYQRMLMAAGSRAPMLQRSLVLSALAAVLEGLTLLCLFPLIAELMAANVDYSAVIFWLSTMVGLTLLEGLARWKSQNFSFSEHYAEVGYELRLRLGIQLRRMPLFELSKRKTGELATALAGSIEEVMTPMGILSAVVIRCAIVPLIVVVYLLIVDWRLGVLLMLIFPLLLPLYLRQRQRSTEDMNSLAAAHGDTSAAMVEYTQGMAVLRACQSEGEKAASLQQAINHLEQSQAAAQKRKTSPGILSSAIIEWGLWVLAVFGVLWTLNDSLALATLCALLVISVRLGEPITFFIVVTDVFDYMNAGLQRLERLLAIKPLQTAEPQADSRGYDITLDNLSYRFPGQTTDCLRNISLQIPERSFTALVGRSGAGKTTLTRLLMRQDDATAGRILIGGAPLSHMPQDEVMTHFSVVFQDVYLFDDSILENIRMSKPDASDAEVQAAAETAYCHEFISRLPQGYATRVGDIGGRLSGGEKQRISIARAILKNAPVVILDEPTASLDSESEHAVQKAIEALVQSRTVIVIAHRLSTVMGADQIIVLDEGELVQRGTHEALISLPGRYQSMWQAQAATKDWY